VGNGVDIASGTGNAIRGNSIFANNSGDPAYPVIGIDLGDNGVTLNDRAGHTGANLFQNFPVLTSAVRIGGKVTVKGSLAAGASQTYTVDFFSNTAADASGYGQGQTFIGWAVVTTDVNGAGDFTAALDGVPAGQRRADHRAGPCQQPVRDDAVQFRQPVVLGAAHLAERRRDGSIQRPRDGRPGGLHGRCGDVGQRLA
jgi:hypothetical protein